MAFYAMVFLLKHDGGTQSQWRNVGEQLGEVAVQNEHALVVDGARHVHFTLNVEQPAQAGMGVGRDAHRQAKACESGQRPSCEQMIKTLSLLCSRNDGAACTILGRLYIKGDRGLETNVTKGVEYLQKGCTAGDKDGCDDLRRLGL